MAEAQKFMMNRGKGEIHVKQISQLVSDKFGNAPVLEAAVWEISSDDERYLSLGQLLDCNLKCIGLSVQRNEDRCVHAI